MYMGGEGGGERGRRWEGGEYMNGKEVMPGLSLF